MTILYPTPKRVNRTFGRGILASHPVVRTTYTAADEAEHLATLHAQAAEDAEWDRLAGEALAQARLEMGLCC